MSKCKIVDQHVEKFGKYGRYDDNEVLQTVLTMNGKTPLRTTSLPTYMNTVVQSTLPMGRHR